jgi:hypothetical protein
MQTFSFSQTEEFSELRGDDQLVATRGKGAIVEWELEAGGISLLAWEILTGGVVIEQGIAPNRRWTLRKLARSGGSYFRIEGRMLSDSGGDVHGVVYRCRVTDSIEGEFADGEYFVTNASGQGLPLIESEDFDLLYDIVQNETAMTIPTTPVGNPPAPPMNLAAGAPTGSSPTAQSILTWSAVTNADTYNIYRRKGAAAFAAGTPASATAPTVTSTQTGLDTGTWEFKVTTVVDGIESQFSNVVTVVVP